MYDNHAPGTKFIVVISFRFLSSAPTPLAMQYPHNNSGWSQFPDRKVAGSTRQSSPSLSDITSSKCGRNPLSFHPVLSFLWLVPFHLFSLHPLRPLLTTRT